MVINIDNTLNTLFCKGSDEVADVGPKKEMDYFDLTTCPLDTSTMDRSALDMAKVDIEVMSQNHQHIMPCSSCSME